MSNTPPRPSPIIDTRPIRADGGRRGALVLHGLTGTPHEIRAFAIALVARGFSVSAPLLAGHGDLEALEHSGWRDWYASAERGLAELRRGCDRVLVFGFSLGGLLALRLAALAPTQVDALAVASVPLSLPAWQQRAIATFARLRRAPLVGRAFVPLPKRGPDVRVRREFEGSPSLRGLPWPALAELVALQHEVDGLLERVRAPLLVMHGALDHTAPVDQSARLAQRVASVRLQRLVLPESFHIVGVDVDRDAATAALVRFAEAELGAEPPAEIP